MAWNNYNSNSEENDNQKTPWDLRQIYAKLVGEHMTLVAGYRIKRDYPNWFSSLKDLFTFTRFKFKDEYDEKEYKKLTNNIIILSNKFDGTWANDNPVPIHAAKIEDALRELENHLYVNMQDGGVFGKGYEYDEDEI